MLAAIDDDRACTSLRSLAVFCFVWTSNLTPSPPSPRAGTPARACVGVCVSGRMFRAASRVCGVGDDLVVVPAARLQAGRGTSQAGPPFLSPI